mmetsp:Transcript_81388/g.143665  ORF Transcript_81388/g.143665 Transcript_81388/m.143665 type:complete len:190 (+) Transcript_81388:60-629(+)
MATDSDERTEQRAFILARHSRHGLMLLQAEKKKKGIHFQLPGGHVDKGEIDKLGLADAEVAAAARELFEETGLDLRSHLQRLRRCRFGAEVQKRLGTRAFFEVDLYDEDSLHHNSREDLVAPITVETGFLLHLSHEHTGFAFEKDLQRAADMTSKHSGGKCSIAIMATQSLYRPEDCCLEGVCKLCKGK